MNLPLSEKRVSVADYLPAVGQAVTFNDVEMGVFDGNFLGIVKTPAGTLPVFAHGAEMFTSVDYWEPFG